ncbi:MAG: hypothetical protein IT329_03490 [Caldilineaceae bacterium]|nr:hypothetical protein [Caldilineaceae bacterium]
MRRLYWLSILVICSTALSTILAGCFGGASERLQSLARGGGRVVWAPAVMNAGEAPLQPLTAPAIAGQIGGQMQGIAVQGRYAYMGVGPRLTILDLSAPDRPTLVGQTSILPGLVYAVTVEGNRAYVTTEGGDLRIVDVTDAAQPRDITAEVADRPRAAQDPLAAPAAAANGLVYQAAGRAGLQIVDASNPDATVGSFTALESAADVQVDGSTAYVVDPWSGLHLLDVTTPAAPREIGQVDTPGLASQVAVAGSRAYLLDRWFGLYIVDVSNAQSPALRGRYAAPQQVDAVVQAGSTAYTAARGDGLWVIDLSDPAAPRAVAHVELPEIGAGLALMDGYLYVAAGEAGLYIYRLDNARAPEQVAVYTAVGSAVGVAAAGGFVYIADEWMGLRIVNVADPRRPVEVASVEGLPVRDVAVVGNLLYVAADDADLQVFDVADPSTPRPAQTYAVPGDAMGVEVNGGYAYVAAGGAGFQILALADGAVVGGWGDAYGRALYYAGGTVYLTTEQAGVQVIDVTTPAAPRLVKGLETFGAATNLFGSDAAIYVADEVGGLLILKTQSEQGENR